MPASANSQKVLFVDDDAAYLETLSGLFAEYSQGAWQVFTAENAGKALGLMLDHKMALIVIDMRMPVVDGVQFLTLVNRKHPHIPKAVLTGFGDEASRTACLNGGADLFLEKPRNPQGLETLFSMLTELSRLQENQGFQGVLRQASLSDVIQMECLSRHSLVLQVTNANRLGEIFIQDGDIIHAEYDKASGESAFNAIVSLSGGEFALKPFRDPGARTIEGQWEFLLMEAARLRDEAAEAAALVARPEVEEKPDPRPAEWESYAPSDTAFLRRPPADDLLPVNIDEMLICGPGRDLIYEWQAPNPETRITLLEFIAQKSRQLGLGLPVGPFDRLEVKAEKARLVAAVQGDRSILIRTHRGTGNN